MNVKGVSTLYDDEGNVRAQWVKEQADADSIREQTKATIDALLKPVYGKAKPTKAPKTGTSDILALYPIADAHLGLYSWEQESGENYDLDEGELNILAAVDRSVDSAPKCDQAIVAQLGDFFHIDDASNTTPASGHQLDVDSRFPRVVETGVRTLRHAVETALGKHKHVRLIIKPGNHDPNSAYLLRAAMVGYFENEPRVTVDDTYRPVTAIEHGQSLLGFTHGHAPKPARMVGVLSVDYREAWGRCAYRYIHHGHLHNRRIFEEQECLIECHRAVTAKDRWTAEMGFRSGRDMQAIMYHNQYGEVERHTACVAR